MLPSLQITLRHAVQFQAQDSAVGQVSKGALEPLRIHNLRRPRGRDGVSDCPDINFWDCRGCAVLSLNGLPDLLFQVLI